MTGGVGAGRSWIRFQLLTLLLLLGAAFHAHADDCSAYPLVGGVHTIDGDTGVTPPSQLYIDTNCTIKNFPVTNPFTSNISFNTQPGQTVDRKLVIFDNVYHTG